MVVIKIMVKIMMTMMKNATNRWRESLPPKNNQKQPIGSDRLPFTAMRIILMMRQWWQEDDFLSLIMIKMVMDEQYSSLVKFSISINLIFKIHQPPIHGRNFTENYSVSPWLFWLLASIRSRGESQMIRTISLSLSLLGVDLNPIIPTTHKLWQHPATTQLNSWFWW